MKLHHLILGFALFLPANLAAQSTDFSKTLSFIQSEATRVGVPGLSYAITKGDQVVASGGIGVRSLDTGAPVDADTLFHIGSTHKSITAFMLARLAEQGGLSWKIKVSELVPQFSFSDSVIQNIKLMQLMNMTSGILDYSEDDLFDAYNEDSATPADLMSFVQSYRSPEFPNKEFSYSNMSVSLAGYFAVYRAGGNTSNLNYGYSDLLREYVLDPLGMNSSTIFVSEARSTDNYSVSHEKSQGSSRVAASYDRDDDVFAPAGSLKSSANDMARYIMTIAQKGLGPDGRRYLNKKGMKRLWRPSKVSRESKDFYGLGWDKRKMSGVVIVTHEGAYDNFTSVIAASPKHKAGLVILANTEAVGKLLSMSVKKFAEDLAR